MCVGVGVGVCVCALLLVKLVYMCVLLCKQVLTDLKSKIIDLEGHLAMKDSNIRRLREEVDWKDSEIKRCVCVCHQ